MAGIPASALRRALAQMSERAGFGAGQAYRGDQIMGSASVGAFGGGLAGGIADEATPGEETAYGPAGVFGGAALGALGGGGAKLAHMAVRGVGGGLGGLRQALAEAAAERGAGRVASRQVEDAGDAIRFAEASAGPRGAAADGDAGEWFRTVARGLSPADQERLATEATDIPSGMEWLRRNGYSDEMIEQLMRGVDY